MAGPTLGKGVAPREAAGPPSAGVRLAVVAAVVALLVGFLGLTWSRNAVRSADDAGGSPMTGVTNERFALVDQGMTPAQVRLVLGPPARKTASVAEGLAWPEPRDSCWYYPSPDRRREYQVCFVYHTVITRNSYPVGEGTPS